MNCPRCNGTGVISNEGGMTACPTCAFARGLPPVAAPLSMEGTTADSERIDLLEAWIKGDWVICPPGTHGGASTTWLLSRDEQARGDRYGPSCVEHEGATLREAIDHFRAASRSPSDQGER